MKPSVKIRAAWLIAIGIVPFIILHIAHQLDVPNPVLDEYRIETMRIVESHSATPPVDAEWQEIDASTYIRVPIRRENFNSSWIAIDLTGVPRYAAGAALYMRLPEANVAVYLGSRYVGSSGRMQRPLPFYVRPLYFALPIGIEASQPPDTLYIRLAREGGYITPNDLFIGPSDTLGDIHRTARFYGLWLPAAVVTIMFGLASSLLVLYFLGRREFTDYGVYGIYGVIVVIWSINTMMALIDHVPIHHWTFFALLYLSLWWVILSPMFANRFFRLRLQWLERSAIALGLVLTAPIVLFLIQHDIYSLYYYYAFVWVPFILLCSLVVFVQYAYASWRYWSVESIGLYVVGIMGLVFGIRDYLFDFTTWIPGTTFYIRYVGITHIAFINLIIVYRYVRSSRDLVALNNDLEMRVQQKAREIEAGYEQRRLFERERTLSQERDRLMRDMHDGLGGQLIQALAMSEKDNSDNELKESLERALVDLRLIVDSIAPANNDLISLLASFRHRSKRVWERSGVRLHWDMGDIPATSLWPEQTLNLLRILQEASTNALRHGEARNIAISTCLVDDRIRIEIVDDGKGFDPDSVEKGFGLGNMRRRADDAGLNLSIESSDAGTRVAIELPTDSW